MTTFAIKRAPTGELSAFIGEQDVGSNVNARQFQTSPQAATELAGKFGTAVTHPVQETSGSIQKVTEPQRPIGTLDAN